MTERNAEIWSTRLQRELLALTAEDQGDSNDTVGVLPPFVKVNSHELDITKGVCKILFQIDVPEPKKELAKTETPLAGEKIEGKESESKDEAADETESNKTAEASEPEARFVLLTLDASLSSSPDGKVDVSEPAYPFLPPTAILHQGAELFPQGSTIKNGDAIGLELDWTPSLHLNDAILNVGLKVKESIRQGEPFHPAVAQGGDAVEDIMKGARRLGNFFSKSAQGLVAKSDTKEKNPRKKKRASVKKKTITPENIKIGDEINLLEAPWVDSLGVYSCKAIRRPSFIEETIAHAEATNKNTEAAGASLAGAGSMFRSFAQSAKSVLEESFLMITDTHIIELRSSKLSLSTGTVTFAISIDMLGKLKFRRQESISLFFKPAPEDPLVFMCPDSGDAVKQIQSALKAHGVKGKHTNASTQKAVNEALRLVQEIQGKERALESVPTVERVNEIMDLYRQAAEYFESAGDPRHEEVVAHMRKFLASPLAASILDGSYQKKESAGPTIVDIPPRVPQGEVLERNEGHVDDDDSVEGKSGRAHSDDAAFHENMDSILKEAKEDLDNLNLSGDDGTDDINALLNLGDEDGTGDDTIADLDAMLKDADKELADIMNS